MSRWSCEDVSEWLRQVGLGAYAELLGGEHRVDGATLLELREEDLRRPPLAIPILGDLKRLWSAIATLQVSASSSPCPTDPTTSFNQIQDELGEHFHKLDRLLIAKVEAPDTPTKSWIKTLIAFIYCSMSLLVTAFVMVIVHDRVPDMKTYPPLPDLFLDNVPLIAWAFEVCEMIALSLAFIWAMILIFHRHRLILLCRMFALTGTVFLLRCITMLITSLSVPGQHLECSANLHSGFSAKFHKALKIWLGMGMSLKGVRSCGDYMFSGHTTALTLLNHFITEYSPDSWHYLHTTTWVLNLFGIFFILAGHEHYSIDVFVAFYISSRLFLYYHSMANTTSSSTSRDSRTRIWFPLFWFFESGRYGRVRNEFHLPLPSLASLKGLAQLLFAPRRGSEHPATPPLTKGSISDSHLLRKSPKSHHRRNRPKKES